MNQMPLEALLTSPLVQLDLVGLAGIVVWHQIPRGRAYTRLVVQIAFFVVMTAILVGNNIALHRFEGDGSEDASALLVVSAKLLWWVHLAWAVIGFVRIYLVFEGRPREASSQPPSRKHPGSRWATISEMSIRGHSLDAFGKAIAYTSLCQD